MLLHIATHKIATYWYYTKVAILSTIEVSKISINLDSSLLEFLDEVTDNRSAYISGLIREQKRKAFEAKLEADYREQSNDPQWQEEIRLWDNTTADGLDDSVEGMVRLEKEKNG